LTYGQADAEAAIQIAIKDADRREVAYESMCRRYRQAGHSGQLSHRVSIAGQERRQNSGDTLDHRRSALIRIARVHLLKPMPTRSSQLERSTNFGGS
jgi:hypothetical protein